MSKNQVLFMGTPQIAADVLQAMLDAKIEVAMVITQPDKRVGRKHVLQYSPVKELAIQYGIPCFQPYKIKEDFQPILDQHPDLIVTCAYGQIVPDEVLMAPTYGCVNLHGSLLPKYRGGAPIQRAVWDGETISGMSLMKMVSGLDAGPVFDTQMIEIQPEDTSTTIFEKMGKAAGQLLIKDFDRICSEHATYIKQDESQVTYAPIITKAEEHLDFHQEDTRIINQIRALSDHPGAYIYVVKKKLKLFQPTYKKGGAVHPLGTILGLQDDQYAIALHEGILLCGVCQMEGKPQMKAKDFYNGQGRNLVGKIAE